MSRLEAFLNATIELPENIEYVATTRIKDADGNPLVWELRAISEEESTAIRKDCMRIRSAGKYGQTVSEMDGDLYSAKLSVACTVSPDLHSVEFQNKHGVKSAESLLRTILTPGEFADYWIKVQTLNDFEIGFQEQVNEAKN